MGRLAGQITVVVTGEVRDADGNLLNQEPVTATAEISEEQAKALLAELEDDSDTRA